MPSVIDKSIKLSSCPNLTRVRSQGDMELGDGREIQKVYQPGCLLAHTSHEFARGQ